MIRITDQLGKELQLAGPAKRIVSLVPSQTELLHALGLEAEVVGITKFCTDPPEWYRSKQRIGGTKNINPELIRELAPDLVIANKEENVAEQVSAVAEICPVYVSDVNNLSDALYMIRDIGTLTGRTEVAGKMADAINNSFALLPKNNEAIRTAYFIWKDPYMVVGGDSFIHDMLQRTGLDNVFRDRPRYPQVSLDDIRQAGPELLLLSSEPYPFKQKDLDELQSFLPEARILLVDGSYFSWYGSRLLHAASYFQNTIIQRD